MAKAKKSSPQKKKTKKATKKPAEKSAVLVTGAAGFVGSTAVDYLLEKGYSVVATDLEGADFRPVIEHQKFMGQNRSRYRGQRLEIVPADLMKKESLAALFKGRKIKYILHPAALFNLSAPKKLLYGVNVDGTKNLLDAALAAPTPPEATVVWSTAMVYGRPQADDLLPEDHPKNPLNHYAGSKWAQEQAALSYAEKGLRGERRLRVAAIRPAAVYGPRSVYGLAKGFIPMAWGFLFPIVPIPGSGGYMAHYIHVDDLVGAAVHLAERMNDRGAKISGESFNVCDDKPGTMEESMVRVAEALNVCRPFLKVPGFMVKTFGKLLPRGIKLPLYEVERDEIPYMFFHNQFDNAKLKATGYSFKYPDPEVGMYITLRWYARNGMLPQVWYLTHPGWRDFWEDQPKEPLTYADYGKN